MIDYRYPFSTVPLNNTLLFETNETLNAAATRIATQSSIAVVRTSSAILTIANGASSSAIQYVRFNPKTRAVTGTNALTITGGSGTGRVDIYALLNDAGALIWKVFDTSGCTFTLGSGTIVSGTGQTVPPGALLIYSWTITTGAFDSSGGTDQGTATDCWIDQITLANTTAGAIAVTLTDNQTTAINFLKAVSLAANTTTTFSFPGGRFFEGGLLANASAANSIDANIRGLRLRRTQINP